jgi:hypothetical protein
MDAFLEVVATRLQWPLAFRLRYTSANMFLHESTLGRHPEVGMSSYLGLFIYQWPNFPLECYLLRGYTSPVLCR